MNLPNQITIGRLFLAAFLFVFLDVWCREQLDGWIWYVAFSLYMVTVLSDSLDGYLARARGEITAFGRIADPFADKVVICGILVLGLSLPQTRPLVPTWIVLVVLAREFLVSGLRGYLESRGIRFGASWEGKFKLVTQAVYCGAIVFYPGHYFGWVRMVAQITLWTTLAISVYSAWQYVGSARRALGELGET